MSRTLSPDLAKEVRQAIASSRRLVGKKGSDPDVEKWIQYRRPAVYNRWIGETESVVARLAFIADERRARGWPSSLSDKRRASIVLRRSGELRALKELTYRRHMARNPTLGPQISISTIPTGTDAALAYIIAEDTGEVAATGDGFRVLVRHRTGDGWPIVETAGPRAGSYEARNVTEKVALEAQGRFWAGAFRMVWTLLEARSDSTDHS